MNDFLVPLPSNSSGNFFPGNTISHFYTRLAQRIELDKRGIWVVALMEFSHPPIKDNRTRQKRSEMSETLGEGDEEEEDRVKRSMQTLKRSIYVYTDIIKPQLVGDSFSRCLRIVEATRKTHHVFNTPYYCALEKVDIENIEILLKDQFGEKISFVSGDTPSILSLHFKNLRPYW